VKRVGIFHINNMKKRQENVRKKKKKKHVTPQAPAPGVGMSGWLLIFKQGVLGPSLPEQLKSNYLNILFYEVSYYPSPNIQ
jgi:hypothetical protein